ncbi:hypothetical protein [Anaeromicropila herbilytica]|uniref:Uncharacterized protein n=1 Tax=Anaeromicropila herbilytica TaxID=2785025 RepID=A0A7R7ENL0_9FIRM|nr:hypothetical protein [Anaeromicropila herbilytica]BCN32054.1 hypothetical protein bsdtb5_33490 [Anaeromicropila herbilytica]
MSYVSPDLRDKFESLSIDLKNSILERDVSLTSLEDLIHVLEDVIEEKDSGTDISEMNFH